MDTTAVHVIITIIITIIAENIIVRSLAVERFSSAQ